MFYVGQKVVCVNDAVADGLRYGVEYVLMPILGEVYTISAVGLVHPYDPAKLPCVLVSEINRKTIEPIWAHRFRPIVEKKTNISIFTDILDRVNGKQSERV